MLINEIISRIRAYRSAQNWSVLRLAKEAGLAESTIRNIDAPDWNPTLDTMNKLQKVVPEDWSPESEAA